MRIERINNEKDLALLQGEWNSLLQRSAVDSIFLTWEWLTSWWAAYRESKQLFVLIARDPDEICRGIAPLYVERYGNGGRRLRFIGDGTYDSDYLDFIIERGQEPAVLLAFVDHLKALRSDWKVLQLNEIPETSPSLTALRNLEHDAGWLLRQESVPCGIGKLPATWEEFLQTLRPRFRTSVRGCMRNLEQWSEGVEVLAEESDISAWLKQLFELHSERWSLRQQSGVFATENKRKFYDRVARSLFERNWLHMTRWRVNGVVLSCQFGFVYDKTYHLLQEGFDSQCTHVSPGITLRAATIRDLISRGVHTYDFLGGMGRHKTDWGASEKKSWRLTLAPASAAAYVYVKLPESLQNAKDLAKRRLPKPLVDWWKGRQTQSSGSTAAKLQLSPASLTEDAKSWNWKETAASVLYETGLLRLMQQVSNCCELRSRLIPLNKNHTSKFVILCYHRVGTGGVPLYSGLEPQVFEAQMRFLRERYRLVSLNELYRALSNAASSPQQAVAITFDDGYRDVYTHAFPVLKKYRIPATIYLTAQAIDSNEVAWYDRVFLGLSIAPGEKLDVMLDRPRRFLLPTPAARLKAAEEIISYLRMMPDIPRQEFCIELEKKVPLPVDQVRNRMLTWEQSREMQQWGVSIGSHTLSHPVISRLDSEAIEQELRGSKTLLEEKLGRPVLDFAYPFGKPADYGSMPNLVAGVGYRTAVTTNWGFNTPDANPFELRRVSICEERRLATFAVKLTQLFLSPDERNVDAQAVSIARKVQSAARIESPKEL